jgi:hypothetical protein
MKRLFTLKHLLLAASVVFIAFIGFASFLFFYALHLSTPPRVPAELEQARVLVGEGAFEKRLFYEGLILGEVSQIAPGWPADREGAALVVVGNEGARFLSVDGVSIRSVVFSPRQSSPIQIVRLNRQGDYGFLARDPSWIGHVILFDRDGERLWSYSSWLGVDDAAAGFVNGESTPVFVVGLNGSGGVHLLDRNGKEIWQKKDGNVWHVEILDPSGDGHGIIFHSNAGGKLIARDGNGEVLARYAPTGYVCNFALTRWGPEPRPTHLLIPPHGLRSGVEVPSLRIIDSNGQQVAQLAAPLGHFLDKIEGTSVRFKGDTAFYAALQYNSPIDRSLLFFFDDRGQLVYQEVLADTCRGIGAVRRKSGETLQVGCAKKIWEYKLAPSDGDSQPVRKKK